MLANVIVTGLGLVRTPLMTWVLPKDEVGMLGVVASWLPFIQLLSFPGLDAASYHYIAKGQRWAFAVNLAYRLRWSLVSALALLGGAAYWTWQNEPVLAWMFVVAGLSFPLANGLSAVSGTLGAQEQFKALFWYRLLESLTDFTGFIPLLFSTWWLSHVLTFYGFNQLATAVMLSIYSAWLWRQLRAQKVQPMPAHDKRLRSEMLRYGKHQTALVAIGVAQNRTDALLVGVFLSLNTMADYSIALLVYEQFRRLWMIYLSVRYPPLVRLPERQRRRRILYEGLLVWAGFAFSAAALYLLAHWLIPLILPPNYASSIVYIGWLAAIFVVGIPGFLAETYFRTRQDEKSQYLLRITAAIFGVALPALLLPTWGIIGVMAGRFLASLILSLCGTALFVYVNKRDRQT
ncbi:MAG: oligosaccharide flippase family protein [Chloroflexota bacterium]